MTRAILKSNFKLRLSSNDSKLKTDKEKLDERQNIDEESAPARRDFKRVCAALFLFILYLHTSFYIYLRGFKHFAEIVI